jgi:hypothetical protein
MTTQQRLVTFLFAAAACALMPGRASADPIVLNPGFSLGNTGFTSGYGHVNPATLPSARALWPEGTYTVGANPSDYHELWNSFGDHTTGDGNMLIVNGSVVPEVVVWSTTVEVTPETQYDFSAWLAPVYPESPACLAFSIDGVQLDSPIVLSSTPGLWQEFRTGWYSGAQTTVILSVTDLNTVATGNDFALDDIALTEVQPPVIPSFDPVDEPEIEPVPEAASSVFLLGLSLSGLAGLIRRWA